MENLPHISILTPVFKRRKFIDLMLANIINFKYDKSKLEWFILDSYGKDGDTCNPMLNAEDCREIQKRIYPVKFKYSFLPNAMTIGEKRNYLSKNCSHKIMINMDSDDYYLPDYILYSVHTMKSSKKELVGSPQMIFYYPEEDKFSAINCPAFRQIHEATMCYTQKHFRRMGGYNKNSQGEGAKMIDNCNEDLFEKTDVRFCMICIVHNENTINKDKFKTDLFDIESENLNHFEFVKNLFNDDKNKNNGEN